MQAHLQSSTQTQKTPKLIKFGADVVECLALQWRWHCAEKLGPVKYRADLRLKGVPREEARIRAERYEQYVFRRLPFVTGPAFPQNGLYASRDKLKEALQKIWVHHFLPPENLVRAAFLLARQGQEDTLIGCRCLTNEIRTSGPSGLGAIWVSIAESLEPDGLLGASIMEVIGGRRRQLITHAVFNDQITQSRFEGIGGDSCMRVLEEAKRVGHPNDYRAWTGRYAKQFGFA